MILILLACSGPLEPPEEEQLASISYQVNWESVSRLGPHRLEMTATLEDDIDLHTESFSVLWGSWDEFQVIRARNGRITQDLRVIGGTAWRSVDGESYRRHDDAEIYRADLSTTWNEWDRLLEPFLGGLQLEPDRETVVEGRPAQRYIVGLDPEYEAAGRRADIPTSLSGHVTLDRATGVRLLGEVSGEYLQRGEADAPASVTVSLLRSGIGEMPEIPVPKQDPRKRKRKKKAN